MKSFILCQYVLLACILFMNLSNGLRADTITWTGATGSDWFDASNWTNAAGAAILPQVGDTVFMPPGAHACILTNPTPELAAFTLDATTLTFTNWTTALNATTVVLRAGSQITLPAPFPQAGMSNRVHIICTDFTLATNASINVNSKGFAGSHGPGKGTAGSSAGGGGAGYGGRGGHGSNDAAGGGIYDAERIGAPVAPGSGGGGGQSGTTGGAGGGAVWIQATGTVTIYGTITANGGNGTNRDGGGSGGSIFIECLRFAGSVNGLLSANGGNGHNNQELYSSGGGGGGRIAVIYDSTAQASAPRPGVRFSTRRGNCGFNRANGHGEWGTVWLRDTALLGTTITDWQFREVDLHLGESTQWSVASLSVSNASVYIRTPIPYEVTGSILVGTNGDLGFQPGRTLSCGGNMVLTNGGTLRIFASATNAVNPLYGARVAITGALEIANSSWFFPIADMTNGGSVRVQTAGGVRIDVGGGINANAAGYRRGFGPGRGANGSNNGAGGGYGGKGGNSASGAAGGNSYGWTNAPVMPGSPGGNGLGGSYPGGGSVWLEALDAEIRVDGTITANGGASWRRSGGCAGGGIFIACDTFSGAASAIIRANGSNGHNNELLYHSGGGGGGRISIAVEISPEDLDTLLTGAAPGGMTVYFSHNGYDGAFSVTNGRAGHLLSTQNYGIPGTFHFITTTRNLTIIGEPGEKGAPAPKGYGTHVGFPTGAPVTNTVTSPADELAGQRWACLGWTLATAEEAITSNTTVQAEFTMTTNLFLTWHWTNEWALTVSAGPNGSVNDDVVNGWYTNGQSVANITATPAGGYAFYAWTGPGVPAGQETVNPLTVTMNQARTLEASFASLSGEPKTWNGDGAWESSGNWTPPGMPSTLDEVTIASGTVLLANSRTVGSLLVDSGTTLVFSNWNTTLTAVNGLTVADNGTITLPDAFTESMMSNRVRIVSGGDVTIATNGLINAAGRGFRSQQGTGKGASGGGGGGGGAGHSGPGGSGFSGAAGISYGSLTEPSDPGSGGGNGQSAGSGGIGGGAVWIEATNSTVQIDGTINADATAGSDRGGGGSGGSILIRSKTFQGSPSGLLTVRGGNGHNNQYLYASGGGSGGRIVVEYDPVAQNGIQPGVRFRATAGLSGFPSHIPGRGTPGAVFFEDATLVPSTVLDGWLFNGVDLFFGNVTEWNAGSLTVNNCSVTFRDPIHFNISGNTIIGNNGSIGIWPGPNAHIGGNLQVQAGGALHVYSGPTNTILPEHGARVKVEGMLSVATSGWIYPYTDPLNGGAVRFEAAEVQIASGGGFNADGRGYAPGYGPGKGVNGAGGGGGGGGFGGAGGSGNPAAGGQPYGSNHAPTQPGSPGGNGYSSAQYAGGVIWIEALDGTLALNGTLTANGLGGESRAGGSAGGGVLVAGKLIETSATTLLRANGANGSPGDASNYGGGGGGGRIAIWQGLSAADAEKVFNNQPVHRLVISDSWDAFEGTVQVNPGTATGVSRYGQTGSVAFLILPPPAGTLFFIR